MRYHSLLIIFLSSTLARAAADDPIAVLGKQNEYPGDPGYCEQLIQQVGAGKNIDTIQGEQLQRLNHPQLTHLEWHVGAYQKACTMMVMSRNRPDLWSQIERVCAELKTAPSQKKRHPKEYQTPEQETYNYIFERISKLNHLKKQISQELTELGALAEPEPWQLLDYELFMAYQEKKKATHITNRSGDGAVIKMLKHQIETTDWNSVPQEALQKLSNSQLQELQEHVAMCCEAYDFMREHGFRQRQFWQHVHRITAEIAVRKEQSAQQTIIFPLAYIQKELENVRALDGRIRNQLNTWDVHIDTDRMGLLDVRITKKEPKLL